jgi:tRNA (guanine37-N1)-methyltransferase
MRIDVVTLFPELFGPHLSASLLGKAIETGTVEVRLHDLREHGLGKHRSVDDTPYGGGAGMVMRPEPIFAAVEALRTEDSHVVLMSPRGERLRHRVAAELAEHSHLILICGRYEGVDERVSDHLCDREISIGDYVLAGGELAALVVIETVTRLVPGVIGNVDSLASESHAAGELEYPQYTRPAEFRGWSVPEILVSGNHEAVRAWRAERARELTERRRGDLEGDTH